MAEDERGVPGGGGVAAARSHSPTPPPGIANKPRPAKASWLWNP